MSHSNGETTEILLGKTDGYRYIGIAPVPEAALVDGIKDIVRDAGLDIISSGVVRASRLHYEIGVTSGNSDERLRAASRHIIHLLTEEGETVVADGVIRPMGFGGSTFESQR